MYQQTTRTSSSYSRTSNSAGKETTVEAAAPSVCGPEFVVASQSGNSRELAARSASPSGNIDFVGAAQSGNKREFVAGSVSPSGNSLEYVTASQTGNSLEVGAGALAIGPRGGIAMGGFHMSRHNTRNSLWRRSSSTSAGMYTPSYRPGTIQQLSAAGITGFREEREKEKTEMQSLNERLASYIEKVNFYNAENQSLKAEIEVFRNQKSENLQSVREKYESELTQARKAIDELSVNEGKATAKVTGLNDEIHRLNEHTVIYESQLNDYRKKVSTLENQSGDLEGELVSLRAHLASREDEVEKQREFLGKYQEQIRDLRVELQDETFARIESERHAQTMTEEASFYKDLLDQLELVKPEPCKIKGMTTLEFWQSNMKKAIREIQTMSAERVFMIQETCDARLTTQISALKSGCVKETMELEACKEEATRLRGQLSESKASYTQLTLKFEALQSERNTFANRVEEMEVQLDEMRLKYDTQVNSLKAELAGVIEQLGVIRDAKLSLEMEIATYKTLLEGEEQRGSSTVESLRKAKIQRSSTGPIGFAGIDLRGRNVVIDNDSSHRQAKNVNIGGWKLIKTAGDDTEQFNIKLKDYDLPAGGNFTVWAKDAKPKTDVLKANEMIFDVGNFGVVNCVWKMYDASDNEIATLKAIYD